MRHYQLFYITACVYNAPYIGSEGALNMSIFMFITAAVLYIWRGEG